MRNIAKFIKTATEIQGLQPNKVKEEKVYIVYGSLNDGKFKPMNMESGIQVTNLIYASIYEKSDLEKLKNYIEGLNKNNPSWKFKIMSNS